ncbi:MAG TPA: prenyltransferase/squalene oxidase repeat-containing protein [Gemmatimonadales bacterium]|jgi:hypothetical protein
MIRKVLGAVRSAREYSMLPPQAREAIRADRSGLPLHDPGNVVAVAEALAWLCRAQDRSSSVDGGVARHFSLVSGWSSSYPETTGYIIPTFFECAEALGRADLRDRARRMLDWLVSIQLPDGSFQGGMIDQQPVVGVVFNTGQILMGLSRGAREWGGLYATAMRRAADWLVGVQDADGAWRLGQSPFALAGSKTYDMHVAWGLLEAARVEPRESWSRAALANIAWGISRQRANGWIEACCLSDPLRPLTHTLGYALRGMLEGFRFSADRALLDAALRTAEGLRGALTPEGFLPGRLDERWHAAARWSCLTGAVQIAYCWLALFVETGDVRLRDAAYAANAWVRRTQAVVGDPDLRGGIKGSFPVNGEYCRLELPDWAAKFYIDALRLEDEVRAGTAAPAHPITRQS